MSVYMTITVTILCIAVATIGVITTYAIRREAYRRGIKCRNCRSSSD
jgi:hypothetical protein